MDLYRENLLDHYRNPRNFGRPQTAGGQVLIWEELNPSCGDKIGVALTISGPTLSRRASGLRGTNDFNKFIVKDVRFWGEGCVVSVAAMSMLTEEVKRRKSIKSIREITGEEVLRLLGEKEMIPPARLNCAFLGLEALRRALNSLSSPTSPRRNVGATLGAP